MSRSLPVAFTLLAAFPLPAQSGPDYDAIAARIVRSLAPPQGERVVMRYDPGTLAGLPGPLEARLRAAGAVPVRLPAADPLSAALLAPAGSYLWLPLGAGARALSPAEQAALGGWLDGGGTRREVHFHWAEGTRGLDGLPADHPAEFDKLYFDALDIDYQALDAAQESAIRTLRLGTIRVLTPAGTDVMFRAGIRKFNRQNGDASPARAKAAQMRVDREIELPAGAIRLAPIEDGVAGQIVLPEARFGGVTAKRVVLQLDNGRITRIAAAEGLEAVKEALAKGGDAAMRFREFALGFNPRLAVEPGSRIVPYYGYGAGVVRLSLGGNGELGGSVAGDFARWLFFTDASVHVDFRYVVKNGRLGM